MYEWFLANGNYPVFGQKCAKLEELLLYHYRMKLREFSKKEGDAGHHHMRDKTIVPRGHLVIVEMFFVNILGFTQTKLSHSKAFVRRPNSENKTIYTVAILTAVNDESEN